MTETELYDFFYDWWSNELPSYQLILANQSGVQPDRTYATYFIVSVVKENFRDQYRGTDEDGIQSRVGFRRAVIDFNILGTDAKLVAESLIQSLCKDSVIEQYFRSNQIAIIDVSEVRDLTELLETEYDKRLNLEVSVRYREDYTDDVGLIETAIVNGDEYSLE